MIPQHSNPMITVPRRIVYPTRTYKHTEKPRNNESEVYESRIIGIIDALSAIEQAILHILRTERHREITAPGGTKYWVGYNIYPAWYGIELEDLHFNTFGFFRAVIHQRLTDALTTDDRIDSVTINAIERIDIDSARVDFIVHTNIENLAFGAEIGIGAL